MADEATNSNKGKGKATENDEAIAEQSSPTAGVNAPPSVAILAIGMAGSGKTTLIHRLTSYLHAEGKPPYILNLDPAVVNLGYEANIDIRDTIDYKEVMKQYNLGPNGGILTALNLFTTKFDQVLSFVDKKSSPDNPERSPYILLDTPGQIEIFTWSASGAIITDSMASSLPTVVAYIIDTPRTTAPETFMSNMLYACSILYKTKLPFILVFNKTDVVDWEFAQEWMSDFEKFQEALMKKRDKVAGDSADGEGEGGFMTSLMSSMSLVLEEFYKNLRACGVSAMTGEGMEDFFDKVEEARLEYEEVYKPELEQVQATRAAAKDAAKAKELSKFMNDMKVSVPLSGSQAPSETSKGKSSSLRSGGAKKTPAEMLAEMEAAEAQEELDEAEAGWREETENDDIYREDQEGYGDLRKEYERRSGKPKTVSRKAGVEEDEFGSRWPAP